MFKSLTLLSLLALGLLVCGSVAPGEDSAGTADIHGDGAWNPDAVAPQPVQRWNLDIQRAADDTFHGRITVEGSPLLTAGNVEGKFAGAGVSGTVSDDDGKLIVTFRGMTAADGMSGQYTDQGGGVGDWHWDGPPPN